MTSATAAGKAILLGEHAVVYDRPAIAVPVSDVRARATVHPRQKPGIVIEALDLDRRYALDRAYDEAEAHPLQLTVRNTLDHLGAWPQGEGLRITIRSAIPIARGMGSGTAVATALVRALARYHGRDLDAATVSDLVYETEVVLHGTPSGVDNTVVAYEQPVYFCRGEGVEPIEVAAPLPLLIGDTGIPSCTRDAVAAVRAAWERDRDDYARRFDAIAALVDAARAAIARGDRAALGLAMQQNHARLRALNVSNDVLGRLVGAALDAGALGAKLSGGGLGGCMIALVESDAMADVSRALRAAGAAAVVQTTVQPTVSHRIPRE